MREVAASGRSGPFVLPLALAAVAAGAVAWLGGAPQLARLSWQAATLIGLLPLGWAVGRQLLAGKTGVDLIALVAMAFSLWAGEALAGAVVALMLAGGQALEEFAGGRARRELSALLSRAPREAHRLAGGQAVTVPLAAVVPGDRLLVRPGEVLPVDGRVAGAPATLDESALTGEAAPVTRVAGEAVRSGTLNAGGLFELDALATADASTYAGIVRLVEQAAREKAPLVRLADRFAIVFLPFTLLLAAAAWLAAGDPRRALAVLVVATPCPLILAAPIAFIAGLSRAARSGVVIKSGAALETLARGEVLLLDKTGTLTAGRPELAEVAPLGELPADEALRLAASLDLASLHPLAAAIVAAARARGLELALPEEAREEPGEGIAGRVGGRAVRVGALAWVLAGAAPDAAATAIGRRAETGSSVPFVAVDGRLAAALVLEDRLRPEAGPTLESLRAAGFRSIRMLTGDRREVANEVAAAVGIAEVFAECSPAGKVEAVAAARAAGVTVMVGDGINDAPALAAAAVGVAMGARGASAASEAADVVILRDRLELLPVAHRIARRARRIALESVLAGMVLSAIGMAAAAAGWLPPVAGAFAQEAIDLAVILNALRALRD